MFAFFVSKWDWMGGGGRPDPTCLRPSAEVYLHDIPEFFSCDTMSVCRRYGFSILCMYVAALSRVLSICKRLSCGTCIKAGIALIDVTSRNLEEILDCQPHVGLF